MTSERNTLIMHLSAVLSYLLLCFTCTYVHAECPAICSCSESHRLVDCSWRGLRHSPVGLQRNIQSLNMTHNRLSDLDHHLSSFTHLRILDISYNRLLHFPTSLPRALWEINISGNRLHMLNKDDTAYHWNLRVLDLSMNKLERVVFINNTLPNLKALNLSHNKFWTVPTNMPRNLEIVDLSHNTLVQILPGSLNQLPKLAQLYLHANRFTTVNKGAFQHLQGLNLITLGDNPWACEDTANISHLLVWTKHTPARVLGCPCHIWHICGEANLSTTERWHGGTYTTLSPYIFGTQESIHPSIQAVTTHFWSETSLLTHHTRDDQTTSRSTKEYKLFKNDVIFPSSSRVPYSNIYTTTTNGPVTTANYFTTSETTISTTRRTTTLRTRSVKRAKQNLGKASSGCSGSLSTSVTCTLLLLAVTQRL